MSNQALNARLTPLSESLKQTQQLINRLPKLTANPGSNPSYLDEEDARVELSSEIHQSLKEQEENFELLRQEVEDQTNKSNWTNTRRRESGRDQGKTDLAAQITRLGEDLRIARAQFRKAQLQAKRNAEVAKRRERELLFAGVQEGNGKFYGRRKGQEKLSQEELLVNASSDVTAALRRTHNLMSTELKRSQFARETLENSTKDLTTLSESYSNLDTLLSSSRSLLSSLIHSQKSDTWYLESAFYILAATIAWLVFRRLIYGPGWWLVYFPLNLLWRLGLFAVQFCIGSLSAATGAVEAKNQSSALSRTSQQTSSNLAQKPTGTGKIPKFLPGMQAPSIAAGAGGRGAKNQQPPPLSQSQDTSLSSQIGSMAEGSQKPTSEEEGTQKGEVGKEKQTADNEQHGTVLRERRLDELPNPKKRMWEEPLGSSQPERPRDELESVE